MPVRMTELPGLSAQRRDVRMPVAAANTFPLRKAMSMASEAVRMEAGEAGDVKAAPNTSTASNMLTLTFYCYFCMRIWGFPKQGTLI